MKWIILIIAITILVFRNDDVDDCNKGQGTSQNICYRDIQSHLDNLTEIQFDKYSKTLVGKTVFWRGEVIEVDSNWTNDDYEVRMSVVGGDYYGLVTFDIKPKVGMSLGKGSRYRIKGKVGHVFGGLSGDVHVTLDNVRVYRDSKKNN